MSDRCYTIECACTSFSRGKLRAQNAAGAQTKALQGHDSPILYEYADECVCTPQEITEAQFAYLDVDGLPYDPDTPDE